MHVRLFPTVWPGHPHALVLTRRSLVRQASPPLPRLWRRLEAQGISAEDQARPASDEPPDIVVMRGCARASSEEPTGEARNAQSNGHVRCKIEGTQQMNQAVREAVGEEERIY
jgi:hypothetical protein